MWRRLLFLWRVKSSRAADRAEAPEQRLDDAYDRQLELLHQVRHGLAAIVTARKQLEAQAAALRGRGAKLEAEARVALATGHEDAARVALERRAVALAEAAEIEEEASALQSRQGELVASQERLAERITRYRSEQERLKTSYNAAKAMVEIGEAATGLGQRMADVGLAIQRARDKTEQVQARAEALDELVTTGSLDGRTPLDRELAAVASSATVEGELERLKNESPKRT